MYAASKKAAIDPYESRRIDKPAWIARQDPVVRTRWTPAAPLSRTVSDDFDRKGFVVIDDLLVPDEVALLQGELCSLRESTHGLAPETVIVEPDANDALRSIFSIHTQSRLFDRLACDARLVRIAQYLLDDEVYIHQSRLNYKPGFDGKEFYWHSDFETWHIEDGMPRMRAVSMSLLLNDNTPNNGALMLIPGSHKHFISCVGATPDRHYERSLQKQELGVPDRESLARLVEMYGIATPLGRPGSLLIFDCNTMHGSNGNITPTPRANAFFVYNAVSNALVAPYGEIPPRPEFIAARASQRPLSAFEGPLAADVGS
jgi:ectoine hydroxylase